MKIEYSPPKHKQPVYKTVKGLIRLFVKKTKVITLGPPAESSCLYLSNHANKMGPFFLDMFFPGYCVKWGAHEMLEGYSSRRAYLRDVLYVQKNKVGKRKAAFKSFFEAFFSGFFYRGIKVLPTYPDVRLMRTVKKSVDVLLDDTSLVIFPENSNDGYFDLLSEFLPGFVMVMIAYRNRTGKDIPVRPMYIHCKKRTMVLGEPVYLQEFLDQGMDKREIAEAFRMRVNELYTRIESGEFDGVRHGTVISQTVEMLSHGRTSVASAK